MNKKPNIILITIDALRADHLGFMGYKKNVSPNLDALAKESFVFNQAYVVGPNSAHSFPSILTSTYPLDYQTLQIDKHRVLLSEVFKKQSYITVCFQTSPFLSGFFGYNRGWDYFEDITVPVPQINFFNQKPLDAFLRALFIKSSINSSPHFFFGILYLRNKLKSYFSKPKPYKAGAPLINRLIKEFITAVKDDKRPFFLWAHYQDVHGPFIPYDCHHRPRLLSYSELIGRNLPTLIVNYPSKNKFFKRFIQNHIKKTIEFYDAGIKYFDEQFGDLLDFLKKENVSQETILCITGDHGDEFFEHGGVGHYERKIYNENLYVPLLIKIPGGINKKIERKVSLIDLAPTLCDLAGIEKPVSFKGKNLFEEKEDLIFHQVSFSEKENFWKMVKPGKLTDCTIACQSKEWKYISDYSSGKEELYYLVEDQKEQNNLIEIKPEITAQMRKKIQEFKKDNPPFSPL